MKIERIWAMPNKWTFTIKPIKRLLLDEVLGKWVDPFCGKNSPAFLKNDLNPEVEADSHSDALEFLRGIEGGWDGVLFDPPYSITQATQCYKEFGKEKLEVSVGNMLYWKSIKDEMARIIRPGGKAICFGWSSMGLGLGRGFTMTRILLVPHGGSKNDTIVTVETKD